MRSTFASLLSGLAGAAALTATHEATRRLLPGAPRMDIAGRRAIARSMHQMGVEPPHGPRLQKAALAGDLIANSLYYALVGAARRPFAGGSVLGSLAGLGAVGLTPLLGLGRRPAGSTPRTKAMTFGYYLLGGLAAALAMRSLQPKRDTRNS